MFLVTALMLLARLMVEAASVLKYPKLIEATDVLTAVATVLVIALDMDIALVVVYVRPTRCLAISVRITIVMSLIKVTDLLIALEILDVELDK
jgi:hypothetical protein